MITVTAAGYPTGSTSSLQLTHSAAPITPVRRRAVEGLHQAGLHGGERCAQRSIEPNTDIARHGLHGYPPALQYMPVRKFQADACRRGPVAAVGCRRAQVHTSATGCLTPNRRAVNVSTSTIAGCAGLRDRMIGPEWTDESEPQAPPPRCRGPARSHAWSTGRS